MTEADALVALQPRATRPINEIIVHCTATPPGRPVSVAEIRAWHRTRGWDDIGYHYVVALDGSIAAGRPETVKGAHVEGRNTGTLGVVYVGGVDAAGKPADTRTPAQTRALEEIVAALIGKYTDIVRVSGHNEYAAKACPSFDVRADPLAGLARKARLGTRSLASPPAPVTNPLNPESIVARAVRAFLAVLGR